MRQIREILRQKWALGRSHRAVAQSLGVGLGTISQRRQRGLRAAGLDWAQVQALTDEALEGRLYGRPEVAGQRQRPAPDCAWIHAERRRPGVTLELLHLEYLEQHPDGYRYTQFCELYRALARAPAPVDAPGPPRRREVLRRLRRPEAAAHRPDHRRGHRGRALRRRARRLELHLRRGDAHPAGARLDRQPHARLRLLRRRHRPPSCPTSSRAASSCPAATSPGSSAPTRSSPSTTAPPSCRPGPAKPRDKAKVEVGVQVAERWILARLRHETFFSLGGPQRPHRRAARRPQRAGPCACTAPAAASSSSGSTSPRCGRCPPSPSSTASGRCARVNIDYHVELDRHYYSVPYALVHEVVDARRQRHDRRALPSRPARRRSSRAMTRRGRHTTAPRPHAQGPPAPSRVDARRASSSWARDHRRRRPPRSSRRSSPTARIPSRATAPASGSCASAAATAPPGSRPPVPGALAVGARSYRHVDSILKHGLDRLPPPEPAEPLPLAPVHEHVRGRDYYQ